MKVLEVTIERGSERRRYARRKLGSRVFRLDPVQNFGVRPVAFHWRHQRGFPPIEMRKDNVSDASGKFSSSRNEMS